jgi:hypothetical protein
LIETTQTTSVEISFRKQYSFFKNLLNILAHETNFLLCKLFRFTPAATAKMVRSQERKKVCQEERMKTEIGGL